MAALLRIEAGALAGLPAGPSIDADHGGRGRRRMIIAARLHSASWFATKTQPAAPPPTGGSVANGLSAGGCRSEPLATVREPASGRAPHASDLSQLACRVRAHVCAGSAELLRATRDGANWIDETAHRPPPAIDGRRARALHDAPVPFSCRRWRANDPTRGGISSPSLFGRKPLCFGAVAAKNKKEGVQLGLCRARQGDASYSRRVHRDASQLLGPPATGGRSQAGHCAVTGARLHAPPTAAGRALACP